MFARETAEEIKTIATRIGMKPATLLAVADVESGGAPFALVGGRKEPLIRFEGHYFDRRLGSDKRKIARTQGLSSSEAGKIANPRAQAARWALLDRAVAIDRNAALESVSWGIGQVMGAHWAWLGYASVEALVAEARGGVAGQVQLMVRYIEKAGLTTALEARDWHAFARGYNGPNYRKQGYHTKLDAAYRKYAPAVGSTTKGQAAAHVAGRIAPASRAVRTAAMRLTTWSADAIAFFRRVLGVWRI